MSEHGTRRTRRMQEQRWLLDTAIRTVGLEWDQPRLGSKIRAAGLEAEGDFRTAARKVRIVNSLRRSNGNFSARACSQ